MNLHTADLTHRLNDLLARRVPPKGFGSDDNLKAQQIGEYIGILRRLAPEGDRLNDWWGAFMGKLADETDTWAWPAPKDVARAAKAAGAVTGRPSEQWRPDSVEINLRRLNDGQPIGEDWLWGVGAMRLEAAGASRHTLRQRRIQMAEHLAATYPPEVVKARLLELKARHEEARARVDDMQRGHRDAEIPNKRAFNARELEALVE